MQAEPLKALGFRLSRERGPKGRSGDKELLQQGCEGGNLQVLGSITTWRLGKLQGVGFWTSSWLLGTHIFLCAEVLGRVGPESRKVLAGAEKATGHFKWSGAGSKKPAPFHFSKRRDGWGWGSWFREPL